MGFSGGHHCRSLHITAKVHMTEFSLWWLLYRNYGWLWVLPGSFHEANIHHLWLWARRMSSELMSSWWKFGPDKSQFQRSNYVHNKANQHEFARSAILFDRDDRRNDSFHVLRNQPNISTQESSRLQIRECKRRLQARTQSSFQDVSKTKFLTKRGSRPYACALDKYCIFVDWDAAVDNCSVDTSQFIIAFSCS